MDDKLLTCLREAKEEELVGGDIFWDVNGIQGALLYIPKVNNLIYLNDSTTGNKVLASMSLRLSGAPINVKYIGNMAGAMFEVEQHYAKLFE